MGIVGAACAAAIVASRGGQIDAVVVVGCAVAATGVTAAVRALVGDSPASLAGAVFAPLFLIATLFDPLTGVTGGLFRAWVAIAAFSWTVVELSRPSSSPLVAMLPAVVAAVLDPSYVALIPIAAWRMWTAPWQRPRWVGAALVVAVLVVVAAIAACAGDGWLASAGDVWCAAPRAETSFRGVVTILATILGPLAAVAALVGGTYLVRLRHAELAVLATSVGALAVSVRGGIAGAPLAAVATVAVALAVARLCSTIQLGLGQAVFGSVTAALILGPAVWVALGVPA